MSFLRNIGFGDNDEVLFFILIFLFLFCNDGLFGKKDGCHDNECDSSLLFFIILFLLLFTNEGKVAGRACD